MYVFLLVVGVIVWISASIVFFRSPAASMFHPATYYLLEHGLIFVIRPIFGYIYDYRILYSVYQFTPSMATKQIVLAGADLSLIVFVWAALRFGSAPMVARPTATVTLRQRRLLPAFLVTAALLLPLAVVSLRATIATKTAGINTMLLDTATGVATNTETNGYFNDAQVMLTPMAALFAWQFNFRPLALLPFVAAFVGGASTGSRGPVMVGAVVLGLLYLYQRRRRWLTASMLLGLVLVYATFRIAGDDRGASIRALFTGEHVQRAPDPGSPLENMDYANMEFFEYIVETIPGKTRTYDYFLDNLQVLTEPIPRVMWPGKPIGAPIQPYQLFNYGYPIGMTYSVPGEGWAQLGWIGIVIWSALFGLAYGKIYTWFVRSRQTVFQTALYMMLLAQTPIVFRDGQLVPAIKGTVFVLLPIGLWKLLSMFAAKRAGGARRPAAPGAPRPAFDRVAMAGDLGARPRVEPRSDG